MRNSYVRPSSGTAHNFLGGSSIAGILGTAFSAAATLCTTVSTVGFNTSPNNVKYSVAALGLSVGVAAVSDIARRFTEEGYRSRPYSGLAGFVLGSAIILQGGSMWSSSWIDQEKASEHMNTAPASTYK